MTYRITPPINNTQHASSSSNISPTKELPKNPPVRELFFLGNGESDSSLDKGCHNICQISKQEQTIQEQKTEESKSDNAKKTPESAATSKASSVKTTPVTIPKGFTFDVSFGSSAKQAQEGRGVRGQEMRSEQPHIMPGQGHIVNEPSAAAPTKESVKEDLNKVYYIFSENDLHDIVRLVKQVGEYISSSAFWVAAAAKPEMKATVEYIIQSTNDHLHNLQSQFGKNISSEQQTIFGQLKAEFNELLDFSSIIAERKGNVDLPNALKSFFQQSTALNTQIKAMINTLQKEQSMNSLRANGEKSAKDGAKSGSNQTPSDPSLKNHPEMAQNPKEIRSEKLNLSLTQILAKEFPGVKIILTPNKGMQIEILSRNDIAAVKLIASVKPQIMPLTVHLPWPPLSSKYDTAIIPTESIDKMKDHRQPFGMEDHAIAGQAAELTQAMAFIPEGPMWYGDPFGEQRETEIYARIEETPDFFIFSTGPVTNFQFMLWLQDLLDDNRVTFDKGLIKTHQGTLLTVTKEADSRSRLDMTIHRGKLKFTVEAGYENHPATMLTWYGANEFCIENGLVLPSEEWWEKAAACDLYNAYTTDVKLPYKFRYGCGNEIDETMANYNTGFFSKLNRKIEGTVPNMFYNGKNLVPKRIGNVKTVYSPSSYGVNDMTGNVWKFTSTRYAKDIMGLDTDYDEHQMIAKGGSYQSHEEECRAAARRLIHRNEVYPDVGFTPALPL